MSGSMKSLLADAALRTELKAKGINRTKEFSLKKMSQDTLSLYRKLAGR